MQPLSLAYFSLGWIAVIYLFNCAIAKKFKKIEPKTSLLYITSVMLIGVFGEVLVDTLYNAIFGTPLWHYRILLIHNGYTSYYSLVIWGMYGFYLYLLHDSLGSRITTIMLAVIISLEAIALEILLNLSHLLIFKEYVFYYLPTGLWHLSALQAIPFYFIAGLVIVKSIKGFKTDPWFYCLMNLTLVSVLVFATL